MVDHRCSVLRAAYAAAPLSDTAYSAYDSYPTWTGYYGAGTFSDGRRVVSTNYDPNQ